MHYLIYHFIESPNVRVHFLNDIVGNVSQNEHVHTKVLLHKQPLLAETAQWLIALYNYI